MGLMTIQKVSDPVDEHIWS